MIAQHVDTGLDALLGYGAAVVKVARNAKVPVGRAWGSLATTTADVVRDWLEQGYNVGLLCGSGNLVDIEYDDEAGAELFRELETRDGTPLCDLATPCWSSQRGMHYLFRLADPIPDRGWVKRSGLEFRFGGKPAQSVLPPSVHPTGRPYSWLVSPSDCEPATICLADLGVTG